MNKHFTELKKTLGKFIANFSVEGEGGAQYIYDGDIAEGVSVFTYAENGDVVALADGDYKIADKDVKVEGGKVTAVTEPQPSQEPNEPQPTEPQPTEPNEPSQEPTEDISSLTAKVNELQSEADGYKAKIAELEAEVERLKNAPLDEPVPQNTDMNNPSNMPDALKGTKYEKAYKFFQ